MRTQLRDLEEGGGTSCAAPAQMGHWTLEVAVH
jgi:hypothetical protein